MKHHDNMPVYEHDSMDDTGHGLFDHYDEEDMDEYNEKHKVVNKSAAHCAKHDGDPAPTESELQKKKSRTLKIRSFRVNGRVAS